MLRYEHTQHTIPLYMKPEKKLLFCMVIFGWNVEILAASFGWQPGFFILGQERFFSLLMHPDADVKH